MANKATKAVKSVASADTSAALNTQLAQVQQQNVALQNVAQQAASKLITIELLASPFLNRKFNWWTALFHLREVIDMIRQIIQHIKEFKDQFMSPPTPDPVSDNSIKNDTTK